MKTILPSAMAIMCVLSLGCDKASSKVEPSVGNDTEVILAICKTLGDSSDRIFQRRNEGVLMVDVVSKIQSPVQDGKVQKVMENIVLKIYSLPTPPTKEMQVKQASEYRGVLESDCIRTRSTFAGYRNLPSMAL